ncbi:hypothetical protein [Actinomadura rubrisoli]|nr:hypothetical protein [Actinomadura rubrisoli]
MSKGGRQVRRASEITARLADCPGPESVRVRAMADLRPLVDGRADLEG